MSGDRAAWWCRYTSLAGGARGDRGLRGGARGSWSYSRSRHLDPLISCFSLQTQILSILFNFLKISQMARHVEIVHESLDSPARFVAPFLSHAPAFSHRCRTPWGLNGR